MSSEFDAFLQPFEIYQQYKVVVEILQFLRQELKQERLTILLVGGVSAEDNTQADHVVRGFLPADEVVVVDPYCDNAGGRDIQALTQLPLKSEAFDVSIILDSLVNYGEHERKPLVDEILRTAKHIAIIGSPFNSSATRLCEQFLHEYGYATFGQNLPVIRRHTQVGLPELSDVLKLLHARQLDYKDFPSSEINLWLSLNLFKLYLQGLPNSKVLCQMVDRYYNENFYLNDHRSPSYRQFIIVNKNKSLRTVQAAYDFFRTRRRRKEPETDPKETFFLMISLINLWTRGEQLNQYREREDLLKQQLDEAQKQLLQLERKVAGQRQSITDKDGQLKSLTETLKEKDREILSQTSIVAKREEEILQLNRQITRLRSSVEVLEETEKRQRECILTSEKDQLSLKQQIASFFTLLDKVDADLQRLGKNPIVKFTSGSEVDRISRTIAVESEVLRERLNELLAKE